MTSLTRAQRVVKALPQKIVPKAEPAEWSASVHDQMVSFFVSLALHSAVLLLLALFVLKPISQTQLIDVVETALEPLPEMKAAALVDFSAAEPSMANIDADDSQVLRDIRQLANVSGPAPSTNALFSPKGLMPSTMPGGGNGFGGDEVGGWGDEVGLGFMSGNGSGGGDGDGGDGDGGDGDGGDGTGKGEVGFFGTRAKGKSFVFIVDCSGSMTTPTTIPQPRQPFTTRFLRARQELLSSLGQLTEDQRFYVIFYNHQTFPMLYPTPIQNMAPATKDHMDLAQGWIQNVVPGGGTDPRDAFRLALALRPEVIFFLTDGIIPRATRNVAKENNKSRTKIHTVAFGLPDNQETLIGIARDNQGRFRFVP